VTPSGYRSTTPRWLGRYLCGENGVGAIQFTRVDGGANFRDDVRRCRNLPGQNGNNGNNQT